MNRKSDDKTIERSGLVSPVMRSADLSERRCQQCGKKCLVMPVVPPKDENSYELMTGYYVESLEENVPSTILCDKCAGKHFDEGRLGFGGDGSAFWL